MSYPDQPPATEARRADRPAGPPAPTGRPAPVVRLAAGTLVAMALAGLCHAVAGLLTLTGTVERYRAAATGAAATGAAADRDRVDAVVTLLRLGTVFGTVLAVLVGVLLVVLALGLLGGAAGARPFTWVVCGIGSLCGGAALAALIGQRVVPLRLAGDDGSTAELLVALADAYPSWWIPVNAALSVGQVLGYLVVAVLLASSPARADLRPSAAGAASAGAAPS